MNNLHPRIQWLALAAFTMILISNAFAGTSGPKVRNPDTAAADDSDPGHTNKQYLAAVKLLKEKEFNVAKTLLAAARAECPQSMLIYSASIYCAQQLEAEEDVLAFSKELLRLSIFSEDLSEGSRVRSERALSILEEKDPVSSFLCKQALGIKNKIQEMDEEEQQAERRRLLMVLHNMVRDALGAPDIPTRERYARRSFERLEELKAAHLYDQALYMLQSLDLRGCSEELLSEVDRRIKALKQDRTMLVAERFRKCAAEWNRYVDFQAKHPDDHAARRARLAMIADEAFTLQHPHAEVLRNYVREEREHLERTARKGK
jgi:hypothetical protein